MIALTVAAGNIHARIVFGSVQVGAAFPGGGNRLSERFDNGLSLGGGVMLQFAEDINMLVRLEYHRLPSVAGSSIAHRGALQAAMVTSQFRYMLRDEFAPWRPFIGLGFGTADMSLANDRDPYTEIGTEWDSDDLHAVFQIGAGVQARAFDRFWVILEARWMSIASPGAGEANSFYPLTLGVEF